VKLFLPPKALVSCPSPLFGEDIFPAPDSPFVLILGFSIEREGFFALSPFQGPALPPFFTEF